MTRTVAGNIHAAVNNNPHFQRATILLQQHRYSDAADEFRQLLANDPNNAPARAMLALCLVDLDKLKDATAEAQSAVGISPDLSLGHYALGLALLRRNRLDEAKAAAVETIRLDAFEPKHFALLSAIELERRNWPGALEQAENALAIHADYNWAVNLRAMALVKLGRNAEAAAVTGAALSQNPQSAVTHANQGWTLLHQGQHKQAMVHFRESLRLNPNSDWAKAGMVEALKSSFWPYRILLKFFLWMGRLSRRAQWGVMLGGYFGYQVLRQVAQSNPDAGKFLWPVLIAYICFCLMTWIAGPLMNLMLRLHRFGRYALSRDQRMASNCIGVLLLITVAAIAAGWFSGFDAFYDVALVAGLLVGPISGTFSCPVGWPRNVMFAALAALLCLGGLDIFLSVRLSLHRPVEMLDFGDVFWAFIIGVVAATFGANWLMMSRPKS